MRIEITDWGKIWHYGNKSFRFALYVYDDDITAHYLSNVKVEPSAREKGLGNKILKIAEKEAQKHGAKTISLKVLKNSWMCGWYQRHGYDKLCNDEDENYIWLTHQLD